MTRQGTVDGGVARPGSAVTDVATAPTARRARRVRVGVGLAVLLALGVAAVVATRSTTPAGPTVEQVDAAVQAGLDKAAAEAAKAPARSAQVYQAILPSMVVIQVDRDGGGSEENSLGSGVIVNARGAIITARHVVTGARRIEVTYADGTKAGATIASEQPENDIAVLAADGAPEVLVPAVMGSSRSLRVGDEAYAVGHPLGLTESMSAGVISGLDRSIPVRDGTTLKGLIQFDTAVNPGNSGGPLLNRDGQVIGIVTGLANPSQQGFFVGVGFAVPIGTAGGAAGEPAQ